MGSSTTLLLFLLIQAILPTILPGDEIILTNTEHEANIGAWMRLEKAGAVIRFWNVNHDSLHLELDELENLLSPKTKWVAMTNASNVLGTVNPITEVATRVHAVGARLSVDAVAYAPHRLIDVQASQADVYVFSFYKVFGPHYAVLWGTTDLLTNVLAGLNHGFIAANDLPYKLQPGGVNPELSYGCKGIVDYLVAMGKMLLEGEPHASSSRRMNMSNMSDRALMQHAFDRFEMHENFLAEKLLAFLRFRPSIRIIGMPFVSMKHRGLLLHRVATICFVAEGLPSPAVVRAMDRVNIGIRFGHFYAKRLMDSLDLNKYGGVVRVSMAHYNTVDEVEALMHYLDQILPLES